LFYYLGTFRVCSAGFVIFGWGHFHWPRSTFPFLLKLEWLFFLPLLRWVIISNNKIYILFQLFCVENELLIIILI
jgi:hypothetical protein